MTFSVHGKKLSLKRILRLFGFFWHLLVTGLAGRSFSVLKRDIYSWLLIYFICPLIYCTILFLIKASAYQHLNCEGNKCQLWSRGWWNLKTSWLLQYLGLVAACGFFQWNISDLREAWWDWQKHWVRKLCLGKWNFAFKWGVAGRVVGCKAGNVPEMFQKCWFASPSSPVSSHTNSSSDRLDTLS